jgi:hypothetical protein
MRRMQFLLATQQRISPRLELCLQPRLAKQPARQFDNLKNQSISAIRVSPGRGL